MATDAQQQGRLAFENNLPMSACTYPTGSTLRAAWMEGWTSARNARPNPAEKADPTVAGGAAASTQH